MSLINQVFVNLAIVSHTLELSGKCLKVIVDLFHRQYFLSKTRELIVFHNLFESRVQILGPNLLHTSQTLREF